MQSRIQIVWNNKVMEAIKDICHLSNIFRVCCLFLNVSPKTIQFLKSAAFFKINLSLAGPLFFSNCAPRVSGGNHPHVLAQLLWPYIPSQFLLLCLNTFVCVLATSSNDNTARRFVGRSLRLCALFKNHQVYVFCTRWSSLTFSPVADFGNEKPTQPRPVTFKIVKNGQVGVFCFHFHWERNIQNI